MRPSHTPSAHPQQCRYAEAQFSCLTFRRARTAAAQEGPFLWYVILTLRAYNLFQVYANTAVGRTFAQKTKQQVQRELGRNPPTYLLVCTEDGYGFIETISVLYVLLDLPAKVRQKIRKLLPKTLGAPG